MLFQKSTIYSTFSESMENDEWESGLEEKMDWISPLLVDP